MGGINLDLLVIAEVVSSTRPRRRYPSWVEGDPLPSCGVWASSHHTTATPTLPLPIRDPTCPNSVYFSSPPLPLGPPSLSPPPPLPSSHRNSVALLPPPSSVTLKANEHDTGHLTFAQCPYPRIKNALLLPGTLTLQRKNITLPPGTRTLQRKNTSPPPPREKRPRSCLFSR